MLNGELITIGDAASLLGVSKTRFRLWVDSGRIKSTKSLAGTRLVSREQVMRIRAGYKEFLEEARQDVQSLPREKEGV